MKIIVPVLIACLLFPISGLTETKYVNDYDGTDWIKWDSTIRAVYITGFMAGTGYVYQNISKAYTKQYKYIKNDSDFQKSLFLWGRAIVVDKKSKDSKKYYSDEEVKLILEVDRSWGENDIKRYGFKSNITVRQINDGLDLLYDDFKNRQILLADAFYVVKKQITGSSIDEIEAILQMLRSPDKDSKKRFLEFTDKDGKKKTVEFP